MYIKKLNDCPKFIAGDKTTLRENLHANKADLALKYSVAHAAVKTRQCSHHKLKTSEVYYVLQGSGKMHIDDETASVSGHDTLYPSTLHPICRKYRPNGFKISVDCGARLEN